jgi:ADP-ribose pyrophosphatase YjhB (NUDIX family)
MNKSQQFKINQYSPKPMKDQMKQLNQVLVCAFNAKGHVLTTDSNSLPHGCMLPDETQREATVRIMYEQTGFVIDQFDLIGLMYDVIKGTPERHVLSYLCTKVLANPNDAYTEQPETHWYNSRTHLLKFQSTQQFLSVCNDYDYNHAALLDASTVSTQMRLPWTKTCYTADTLQDKIISISNFKQKETQMKPETQPKVHMLQLQEHKTYLTREGKEVKMYVDSNCGKDMAHQFIGSNSYYYKLNGRIFNEEMNPVDIVSEVRTTPK